jgi:hypothetical protein
MTTASEHFQVHPELTVSKKNSGDFCYLGMSGMDWFSTALSYDVKSRERHTCRAIAEWLYALDEASEAEPVLGVLERAAEIAKRERSKESY